MKVSLATNKLNTLINYIFISINIKEIEVTIKAWIINVEIYDLLLELSWIKRVYYNFYYNLNNVIISDNNIKKRRVSTYLILIKIKLLIVKFNEEKELIDLIY